MLNHPDIFLQVHQGRKFMKFNKKMFVFFIFIIMSALPAWTLGQENKPAESSQGLDYVLGPSDILDISVWKNDALTKQLPVLPDGKISFPLIGEVMAGGKTVAKLKEELEKKLTNFISSPVLSVVVTQVNSMQIYVIGRVNRPGRYQINTDINTLQALALAGGLTPFAKREKIKLFREVDGKTRIFSFNYDKVSQGENLDQNIQLKRGDVIVAP